MAISKDQLKFTVEVDSTAAKDSVEKLNEAAKKLGLTLKQTSSGLSSLGGMASALSSNWVILNQAWELTDRILMRMNAALGATVNSFAQLEYQQAKINTIISDSEAASMDFGEAILSLKRQFGGETENVGYAFYEAIASGATDAAGSLELVNQANRLAVGGATDLHTALNALTGIMMAYGYSAEETARVNDILFIGAREGKTSIQELAQEMGPVLAIAKQMNVSLDELVAAISTVSSSVGTTAEAVTSVRSALVALARQTDPLTAMFKKMGVSSIQAQIAQEGFVNTLRKIAKESGGSAESILKLMERIEALATFTTMTNKTTGARFDDIMKDMSASANNTGEVTGRAVGRMATTTKVQMAVMKANMEEVFIRIGAVLVAAFEPVVTLIAVPLASVVGLFRDMAVQVTAPSKELWSTLVSLAAAIVAVNIAFASSASWASVIGILQGITKAVVALQAALAGVAVFARMAVLVIGVATAVEYLIINMENLGSAFERIFYNAFLAVAKVREGIASLFVMLTGNQLLREKDLDPASAKVDELEAKVKSLDGEVKKTTLGKIFASLVGDMDKAAAGAGGLGKATKSAADEAQKLQDNLKSKTELNAMTSKFNELINQAQQMNNSLEEWGKSEAEIASVRAERTSELLKQATAALQAEKMLTPEMEKQARTAFLQISSYRDFNKLLEGTASTYGEAVKQAKELATAFDNAGVSKEEQLTTMLDLASQQNALMSEETEAQLKLAKTEAERVALRERLAQLGGEQVTLSKASAEAAKKAAEEQDKADRALRDKRLGGAEKMVSGMSGGISSLVSTVGSMTGPIGSLVATVINFFNRTPAEMKKFIDGLMNAITELPKQVAKNIPIFINGILEKTPETLRGALGGISILLKEVLFSKQFWQDVINGLIDVVIQSFKDVWAWLFEGADFSALGKGVADSVGTALKSITGVGGELFSVEALTEGPVADAATKATKALEDVGRKLTNWLGKAWDALKQAGQWLWDNVFNPFDNLFIDGFMWVWNNVFVPLGDIVPKAFQWVMDNVFSPVIDFFMGLTEMLPFGSIITDAFAPIIDFFKGLPNMFSGLWSGVKDIFAGLFTFDWDQIKAGFTKVFDTVWDSMIAPVKIVINGIIDLINGIKLPKFAFDLPSVLGGGSITIWKEKDLIKGEIPRFASGGLVPNLPSLTGMGTDTVAAALTPGEFVLRRPAVESLGLPTVQSLNMGKMPAGNVEQNVEINLTINTTNGVDAATVKTRVLPVILEELRRASLDGRRVLAPTGVR